MGLPAGAADLLSEGAAQKAAGYVIPRGGSVQGVSVGGGGTSVGMHSVGSGAEVLAQAPVVAPNVAPTSTNETGFGVAAWELALMTSAQLVAMQNLIVTELARRGASLA